MVLGLAGLLGIWLQPNLAPVSASTQNSGLVLFLCFPVAFPGI